jgi:hypothetical protein
LAPSLYFTKTILQDLMSAFAVPIGCKADAPFCTANVRCWPKADIPIDESVFSSQ